METRITRDKEEIYRFLSENPELQLYMIGDLDDFFWPDTLWYAMYEEDEIQSIALLYKGMNPWTLLLFYENDLYYPTELIKSIKQFLPEKFNVHLSPGLINAFGKENIIIHYGQNYRMILAGDPASIQDENIRRLEMKDIGSINDFYKTAYPENWFDSRMVESGKYFGYYYERLLVGVAGIHVYSPEYKIAALGNIAVLPKFRGQKIAFRLTSVLCRDLKKTVNIIGLNVKSENIAAIKCYENIGFEIRSLYDECLIKNG